MRRLVVIAALVAGCSGGMPRPSDDDALRAGTTRAVLESGREVYVRKCGGCHVVFAPSRFPEGRWRERMDEMAARSGLTAQEGDHVLRYLVTMSRKMTPAP